jgi:hypothetical protein
MGIHTNVGTDQQGIQPKKNRMVEPSILNA